MQMIQADLQAHTGQPNRLVFGKHKGRHIKQVDVRYLEWMLKSFPESSPWQKAAADALTVRGKLEEAYSADIHAFLTDLKACSMKKDLEGGRKIHAKVVETGNDSNMHVKTTLVKMYATCSSMAEAQREFDSIRTPDVVSWNVLLTGYVENGEGPLALELFSKMKARKCEPDPVTYVAVLKACTLLVINEDDQGKAYYLDVGRRIHSEIGNQLDLYVQNTLIDMYANCGSMADARRVFNAIPKPSVVSWTALLFGYAEYGEGLIALELFFKMKDGCVPNAVTYVAVLKACASLGALALGRKFHSDICDFTCNVVTCLVDFYAKCGSMTEARGAFYQHSRARGIATWNALLAGYSTCGDTASVFTLFEAMHDEGFVPNAVTFLCVLSCCSHAGLVEKASGYLDAMPVYGITPSVKHYTCIVDALGRANQLHEAIALVSKMPCNPDVVIWMTLLCACRKWKNVEIARWAFQSVMDAGNTDSAPYVLLADIYGSLEMWEEQESVLEEGRVKLEQAEDVS